MALVAEDRLLVDDVVAVADVANEERILQLREHARVLPRSGQKGILLNHRDCHGLLGDKGAVGEPLQREDFNLAVGAVQTSRGVGNLQELLQVETWLPRVGAFGDVVDLVQNGNQKGLNGGDSGSGCHGLRCFVCGCAPTTAKICGFQFFFVFIICNLDRTDVVFKHPFVCYITSLQSSARRTLV